MPRNPVGYNPDLPSGQKLNRLLGVDLRDPTSFLEQIAARKAAPAATPATPSKPKVTQAPQDLPAEPSTPPAASKPATPTAPAAPAAPAAPKNPRLAAARASYESELAAFAERERMGMPVDPLTRKRALQRYENNIGRIKAIEAADARKTKFWEDTRARKARREAANAAANKQAGEVLKSSTAALEEAMRNAQPVKSIDELNAEYTKNLGQQYAANEAAAASKVNAAGQDLVGKISQGSDWLNNAINRSVTALQDMARRTPTAQISEIAAPSAPAPVSNEQKTLNALSQVSQFEQDLKRTPGTINYSREDYGPGHLLAQSEADQAAVDKSFRDTSARLSQRPPAPSASPPPAAAQRTPSVEGLTDEQRQLLAGLQSGQIPAAQGTNVLGGINPGQTRLQINPLEAQASKAVSDRYRNMGVDPMDPNVRDRYMQDVDREIRRLSPTGQVGAPVELPAGQRPGLDEVVLASVFGPGGFVGPPLPPELAAREIAMAPTQAAREMAQGRQATASMQEPFWTLLGGGAMRGGSAPNTRATGTSVINNPVVQGATRPRATIPTSNQGTVRISPGNPGQVVDMPAPQAVPGVTPRDLPTSAGGPVAGPKTPPKAPTAVVRERAGLPNPSRPAPEQVRNFEEQQATNRAQKSAQQILDELANLGFFTNPQ